jgi:hypothetical protein
MPTDFTNVLSVSACLSSPSSGQSGLQLTRHPRHPKELPGGFQVLHTEARPERVGGRGAAMASAKEGWVSYLVAGNVRILSVHRTPCAPPAAQQRDLVCMTPIDALPR